MAKKITVFFISFLIFACSAFFVWAMNRAAVDDLGRAGFCLLGLSVIVPGVIFSLGWLLLDSKRASFWLALLMALPFFFVVFRDVKLSFAVLFSFLCFWLAWHRGVREKEASFKVFVSKILRAGLPIFFTGLALMMAVFYYLNNAAEIRRGDFQVIEDNRSFGLVGDAVLRAVAKDKTQNLSLNLSVDDFIFQLLLQEQEVDREVADNAALRQEFAAQIAQLRREINRTYGLNLTGEEKTATVIRIFINEKIKSFFGSNQQYLPVIFAVAIFLVLKAVSFLYVWLVVFLTWLLCKLLLALGVVVVAKETAEREAIIIR